jgi:hypothetical protein
MIENRSAKSRGRSVLSGKYTRRNSMRFFSMALLIGLFADAIVESRPMLASSIGREALIPSEAVQLAPVGGKVPVGIQNVNIQANGPISEISFNVKNNTDKTINAIAVEVMVKVEHRGKPSTSKFYLTRDQMIHPDISEIARQKTIPPDGVISFGPEPLETYAFIAVKGVSLRIDFVDFSDKTSLGPNQKGSIYIQPVREGATRYKAWLVYQHRIKGATTDSFVSFLAQTSMPPPELDLRGQEVEGAMLYLKHLRLAIEQYGGKEASKYIDH